MRCKYNDLKGIRKEAQLLFDNIRLGYSHLTTSTMIRMPAKGYLDFRFTELESGSACDVDGNVVTQPTWYVFMLFKMYS